MTPQPLSNVANVVSFVALFFSVNALFFLLKGNFYLSYSFALFAFAFDSIDGYLARKNKTVNQFGAALDGYIDVMTYLIYPAVSFFFFFRLNDFGSTIFIFLFVSTGVFRLARFQVRGVKKVDKKMYIEGLPVIFGLLLVPVFYYANNFVTGSGYKLLCNLLLLLTSFLMVQRFNFPKPGNIFLLVFVISLLGFVFLFKAIW